MKLPPETLDEDVDLVCERALSPVEPHLRVAHRLQRAVGERGGARPAAGEIDDQQELLRVVGVSRGRRDAVAVRGVVSLERRVDGKCAHASARRHRAPPVSSADPGPRSDPDAQPQPRRSSRRGGRRRAGTGLRRSVRTWRRARRGAPPARRPQRIPGCRHSARRSRRRRRAAHRTRDRSRRPCSAPEEVPVERELHVLEHVEIEHRVEIHVVLRTDQARLAEVRAAREQRIERLEVGVEWVCDLRS